MHYYAEYSITAGGDRRIPIGAPPDELEGALDTLFYEIGLLRWDAEHEDYECCGNLRARRVLISKIIDEGRSVFMSMDQVDQIQHDVYAAVWDEERDSFGDPDADCGDLIIFEDVHLEGGFLPGLDINRILDDAVYHMGGAALVVYLQPYASLTHFNLEACSWLEGIGYARPTSLVGLAVERSACARANA